MRSDGPRWQGTSADYCAWLQPRLARGSNDLDSAGVRRMLHTHLGLGW